MEPSGLQSLETPMGVKPKTIRDTALITRVLRALWQAAWYLLCSCVTNAVHASRTSNVESIMFGNRIGDGESRLRFLFLKSPLRDKLNTVY